MKTQNKQEFEQQNVFGTASPPSHCRVVGAGYARPLQWVF